MARQYYVTKIDADHIRLSTTSQAAQAAAPINLTLTAAQQANSNLEQYFTASDENPGINVLSTLSAQNSQKTESQVGGSPMLSDILLGYIPPGPKSQKAIGDSVTKVATAAPFTVDGAVALNFYTHNVQSVIGSSAVLESATDVTINASSQNYSQVIADGQVITPEYTKNGERTIADVALAIALGVYKNTVLATVDSGASIDAECRPHGGFRIDLPRPLAVPAVQRFCLQRHDSEQRQLAGSTWRCARWPRRPRIA